MKTRGALDQVVIDMGAHIKPKGTREHKIGWRSVWDCSFYTNHGMPGPFSHHLPWSTNGEEYQNKIKDFVYDSSKYYKGLHKERAEEEGEHAIFPQWEELGKRILCERDALSKKRADAKAAKEKATMENEEVEAYFGAVSPGKGVSAPSLPAGETLSVHDKEGLAALPQQPKSYTERKDINPRKRPPPLDEEEEDELFSSSDEEEGISLGGISLGDISLDDSSVEWLGSKSKSVPKDESLIRDNLPAEAENAERAAKLSVSVRKRNRNDHQRKHGDGKNNRKKPSDLQLEGVIDKVQKRTDGGAYTVAKEIRHFSRELRASKVLQPSQSHNTPPSSPSKKLKTCQDMISSLRAQRKGMIEDGEPAQDIEDVTRRIKDWNALAVKLEQEYLNDE